jgi:hypothetical protein
MSGIQIKKIKPQNIIIFNFYLILTIQLLFNWSVMSCNNYVSIWQLIFLIILYGRLLADELHHNKYLTFQQIRVSKVITSLVLLGMAIAMIALLTGNTHDFDEKTCSLNRISFSA